MARQPSMLFGVLLCMLVAVGLLSVASVVIDSVTLGKVSKIEGQLSLQPSPQPTFGTSPPPTPFPAGPPTPPPTDAGLFFPRSITCLESVIQDEDTRNVLVFTLVRNRDDEPEPFFRPIVAKTSDQAVFVINTSATSSMTGPDGTVQVWINTPLIGNGGTATVTVSIPGMIPDVTCTVTVIPA